MHCGFCTATCPTYVLLGDELDSPRGRIYLIKDMLENERPATGEVVKHIDRCLSCLACMTTCPSGVHYMHLVDHARVTSRRPTGGRCSTAGCAACWRSCCRTIGRFRLALRLGAFSASRSRRCWPGVGLRAARRDARAGAGRAACRGAGREPQTSSRPRAPRRGRVALLTGCVTPVLGPAINEATIRLLTRHGIEVVVPDGQGCCGGSSITWAASDEALAAARHNVDAWTRRSTAAGSTPS